MIISESIGINIESMRGEANNVVYCGFSKQLLMREYGHSWKQNVIT